MPPMSECRGHASRPPASGFAPDAPAAAGSAPAAVGLRSPASALQEARQLSDGDAVDTGRPLIAHHRTQRRLYVLGVTDRLHQIGRLRRAFGFGHRRDHFDLLRERARGFTPARHRQVQHQLDWRSRCGHETSELLALSFNPSSGTVRAFGPPTRPTTPSADFCAVVRRPCDPLSPAGLPSDTGQISWGKPSVLPRTSAGFTVSALDGYGLRDRQPARPAVAASYPIPVRRIAISLHASFRRSLAVPPLRFTRASPPSGCTGDFHPQDAGHAQHTDAARRLRRCRCAASWTATARDAQR
jgi:hypothetical protein